MSCPVLTSLTTAVAAVAALPVPAGLGADVVLDEQVHTLAAAVAGLQRELAMRMAAVERAASGASDVRGDAVRAGLDPHRAGLLRRAGVFAASHTDVDRAWHSGTIRLEQVELLRAGAGNVPTQQRRQLIADVLPLLPGLDAKETRRVVEFAVDQLAPGDPDHAELTEHAARRLAWSRIAGGGLAFEGYLPTAEATAFTTAINALAESLRVAGDTVTPAQRRADALAALVATATDHGLPTGGGLPATLTLTVSLTEAARIAARNPAKHAHQIHLRPRGTATIGQQPAADATIRFGLCCAAITPILTDQAATRPSATDERRDTDAGPAQSPLGRNTTPERRADTPPPSPAEESHPTASTAQSDASAAPGIRGIGHSPGSLLDRITRTPVQPLAVGRAVRLATAAQRQALRRRDGGCVIPGCDIDAAYTQPHHVLGWTLGGTTDLDQLVSLCWVHHRLTELGRFTFHPRAEGEPQPPGTLGHPNWWITPPVRATT